MKDIKVVIEEPTREILKDYSNISIEFIVDSEYTFEWQNNGLGGIKLVEKHVEPYTKDYDSIDDNPSVLIDKFNLSNWCVVSVFDGDKQAGGAIIAFNTEDINMLEGRDDLAVLWDIRINKNYRRMGIGSRIIDRCIEWARSKNCTRFKIETQNNNVKACKFYASQGAKLSNINRYYYKEYPNEIQLIWSIDL
ncbi:GNAT family N-acetyltransferase [Vallitalea okinawensis]|uniref:GNAT family N-acetyltransferase n=1 Tax=Vallitalea okinawensis TaxID=2078660 RepID=UPI000CFDA6F0|nr:GNAT family N-acetyltransferase [Vallitalea okinawensis]